MIRTIFNRKKSYAMTLYDCCRTAPADAKFNQKKEDKDDKKDNTEKK